MADGTSDTPSPTRLWLGLIASLLSLVVLSWILWRPVYGAPAALPDHIRAVEGDVLIPKTWKGNDDPYLLRTSDGRSLRLHCGPSHYRRHCLNRAGLDAGHTYRLTIAYGGETLADGRTRNVITHVVFDDYDLITPNGQALAWGDRNALDGILREMGSRRGRGSADIYILMGGLYLATLAGLLHSAFGLLERRA